MKTPLAVASLIAAVAIASSASVVFGGESPASTDQPKSGQLSRQVGLVRSFEYLGCSGDWPDEGNTPEVWRAGGKSGVYYLVRHADTCGYTIGSKPFAKLSGTKLELSYELSNEDGPMAACPCEYWAKFELSVLPRNLTSISVNGVEARLKGSLAER
jgi:hypothetical protein